MTTKLLIIGNSHVAAMRQGWATVASDYPELDVQFFAANSTLFRQLEFRDGLSFGIHDPDKYKVRHGAFLKKMFGGLTVDMTQFDAVLVVGQNSNEVDYLRQFESYGIDGVRERPGLPRLSQSAFTAFCDGIAQKRLPLPGWRKWTHAKLLWLPVPIPREDCPHDSDAYGLWARYGDEGAGVAYLEPYRDRVRKLYADIGIEVLEPPATIYAPNGLTKVEYGRGAGKLTGEGNKYDGDDFHHMNGEYGAVLLRHILERDL